MARHARVNITLSVLNAMATTVLLILLFRHHRQTWAADLSRAAGLDRRVTNLKMNGMPLEDVLRELQRQTGARLVLSPLVGTRKVNGFHSQVDTDPGWQTPIWGSFHDVTLGEALDVLCRHARFSAPLHYDVLPNGRILLGADDEMPVVVRVYDVRNLTRLMSYPDEGSPILDSDPPPTDVGAISQIGTVLLPTDADRDGVIIEPRWWLVKGQLVVVASRRAQARIAAELEPLRDIHESFPPGIPLVARYELDLTER
jgi:hypothetical protein